MTATTESQHGSGQEVTAAGGPARRVARALADLLFPPGCNSCGLELDGTPDGILFCDACRAELTDAAAVRCRRCAGIAPRDAPPPDMCDLCRGRRLRFDGAVTFGSYDGRLRELVLRMKTRREEPLSLAVGRWMSRQLGERLAELRADVIAPVPMFWTRRLLRGVNSPEILAESLGGRLGLPVRRVLVRTRNTLPQYSLPPSKRFPNVRGAFRIRRGYDLGGARVLLVDDVLTTGATSSEAARALRSAGAEAVLVAVAARAPGAG